VAPFDWNRRGQWRQPIATIVWELLPLTPEVGPTVWMNRGTYNQIVDLRGHTESVIELTAP
jgi:hypothetical protein